MGIPSRYVHNEAHAFVEVYVPRRGWIRIDLGGAAVDFNVRNTTNKLLHLPAERDGFPKPGGFEASYSHRLGTGQAEADIDGDGKGEHIDGAPIHSTGTPRPGPADTPQGDGVAPGEMADPVSPGHLTFPGQPEASRAPAEETPILQPTRVRILEAPHNVFRSDRFPIRGMLTTQEGLPLSNERVEGYLVPKGESHPATFIHVGGAVTNPRGEVTIDVMVPPTAALGPWSIHLFFAGSTTLTHCHSD
jgi:hypothetical protein